MSDSIIQFEPSVLWPSLTNVAAEDVWKSLLKVLSPQSHVSTSLHLWGKYSSNRWFSLKKRHLFVSQRPSSQAAHRIWHGTRRFCSEVDEDVLQGNVNWDELGCWIFYMRTRQLKHTRNSRPDLTSVRAHTFMQITVIEQLQGCVMSSSWQTHFLSGDWMMQSSGPAVHSVLAWRFLVWFQLGPFCIQFAYSLGGIKSLQ